MKEDQYYIDLISRYLGGNTNDEELRQLEGWVKASPENKKQFQALRQSWRLSALKGNPQKIDLGEEWKKTQGQLFSGPKVVSMPVAKQSNRNWYLGIAAGLAILLAAALWFFQSPADINVLAQNEISHQELPDGSKIDLNQNTSIKFVKDRRNGYRRVELTGDAFFDVQRDTTAPFVISTQNLEIEVLGTSFYVDSRVDQADIRVVVATGSVALKAGEMEMILNPNEIGTFNKLTGEMQRSPNEDPNYMAWKTGLINFENTNLDKVVYTLNRSFHSKIKLSKPSLSSCRLTATYDGQSVESIIRIIEKTLNLKAQKTGDQIILDGADCQE